MARESGEEVVDHQGPEDPIHGDTLEAILSHVPLIHLVPASHVSKSWNRAVLSSLRHLNPLKPWLILHAQSSRPPYAATARAYDPRSRVWIEIEQPSIEWAPTLRSSNSSLLYMLSPSKLSFSSDPLHLTWHHADAPLAWRTDPIVALVGRRVIVAGGKCDFEDDPLSVEMYDAETRAWDTCDPLPAVLKDSASSTWLSVAGDNRRLFVTEKHSGVTHAFDPEAKSWRGPYDLRPDSSVFYHAIACHEDRLILIGLTGDAGNMRGGKLWGVNFDSFELEVMGEMPPLLVEKLKSESFHLSSVDVCLAGNIVYIYNPNSMVEEVFACEFVNGGCRWRSVRNAVANGRSAAERVVFTCSKVGIHEVQKALSAENRRMTVKSWDPSGESIMS